MKPAETQDPVWHGGPWEESPARKRTAENPFTPDELVILGAVAQDKGWVWTFRHTCLCLDQARAVGELPDDGRTRWPQGFTCGTRGITGPHH